MLRVAAARSCAATVLSSAAQSAGARHAAAAWRSPVGSPSALVVFMSLIVACRAVFVKSSSKKLCMKHVSEGTERAAGGSATHLRARTQI